MKGALEYTRRDDIYRVFDDTGGPLVPQVCVDFVLDTLERSAGMWWSPQDRAASRHVGRIDFAGVERGPLRRSIEFVRYAKAHPLWFDVLDADPVTALPLSLAGNAGRPRITTWAFEMRRTPERTLRYGVRPVPAWLAALAAEAYQSLPIEPPLLSWS